MDRHFESKCTTACKQNIFDEIRQVHQFSSTHQVASSCYFRRERREKRSLIPKRIRKKSPFPRPQDCNMETGLLGAFVYLALFWSILLDFSAIVFMGLKKHADKTFLLRHLHDQSWISDRRGAEVLPTVANGSCGWKVFSWIAWVAGPSSWHVRQRRRSQLQRRQNLRRKKRRRRRRIRRKRRLHWPGSLLSLGPRDLIVT